MPKISTIGNNLPSSPIRKLVPYAEAAINKGVTVFHLNIGQPDIETPKVVLDRIEHLQRNVIEYSHSAGFASYREGLIKYYASHDIQLDDNDIMVTTGGSEALKMAMKSCFNAGDEVIIPEPFYANYNSFAIECGLTVVPVTAKIEDGFALPPISDFQALITPKTKGILICNPGNPTGYLYSKEELETLRQIVLENDLFLFSDEVYREFCYDDATHFSAMQLEGLDQNVILIDSVSKRYSMCGARVGALVSRNQEVMDTAMKFAQARLSPPTLGQIASEAALNTPASYFEEVKAEYQKRRDILIEGMNKIEGVVCPKPKGAFYAIAKLPVDSAEKFCEWLLEHFNHENTTVMLAPASGFYASKDKGGQEVRIAYVLKEENLRKAIQCIEVALQQYPGSTISTSAKAEQQA